MEAGSAPLLVLHALRLRGFADADATARVTGLPASTVQATLDEAGTTGLAKERTGRISGWALTPDGRAELARLLADDLEHRGCRTQVEQADGDFVALNEPFKQVCTRWQLRPDGTPNEHDDPAYDDQVVADLAAIHPRVVAITDELAQHLPRFGRYQACFTSALERVRGGERRAFTAPMSESYHDTWMELHQDLLSTLGRERGAADGA